MNDLSAFRDVFAGMTPFSGPVAEGFIADYFGTLTASEFLLPAGGPSGQVPARTVKTAFPKLGDGKNGETWFEAVNWIEAAKEARGRYTMITLGACYGAQAVGAWRLLQQVNPMPAKLVLVEPEPDNFQWCRRHLQDNGIDPDQHWLVEMAISDTTDPVLFPVGSPGSGSQNCYATDIESSREYYVTQLLKDAPTALRNLLLHNTTGITKDLVPGMNFMAEIKYKSAVTLRELLGPFDVVDYLESDIQQSEITVFPPFIDLLRKKVRRIHIGTHGAEVHKTLSELFAAKGWKTIFNFSPNATHDSALGSFATNDGILTVRNPDL